MKTKITIIVDGDRVSVEEAGTAEAVSYPIDDSSLESMAMSIGETVSGYLQGIG
jgi:hypothetical protein